MSDRNGWSDIPWRLLLPLILAASGAAYLLHPLVTDRPPAGVLGGAAIGFADVNARLWQDPFRAVNEHPADKPPPARAGSTAAPTTRSAPWERDRRQELIQSFRERLSTTDFRQQEPAPARMLVLPVIVPAAGYAEFAEQRLRTRVAVLSGLARCGYNPEDTAHIGYFEEDYVRRRLDSSKDYATTREADTRIVIPYEWFRPASMPMPIFGSTVQMAKPTYQSVLVLWLNEDLLVDRPVYRLSSLFNKLFCDVYAPFEKRCSVLNPVFPARESITLQIIGPRTSTLLRAMAWEYNRNKEDPLARLHFVCPTATAEVEALLDDWDMERNPIGGTGEADFQTFLNTRYGYNAIELTRVTPSDRVLCQALVRELRNRQIDVGLDEGAPRKWNAPPPEPGKDHVAVIAEWDTFYGRALSLSFAAACSGRTVRELSGHSENYPTNVHPFVYLRGIDGQAANQTGGDKPSPKADKTGDDKAGDKSNRPSDPPEGQAQSDYLRRLADKLEELDARLRHKGQRLRAVGVLGTDVYDKLMILRALRPKLNGVVFFTTELDARYAMHSEWQTTHNLIIAAGFGTQLGRFYQGGVAPFRDSQQTATYTATLVATGLIPEARVKPVGVGVTPESRLPGWHEPRLYEISRNGPYDLSTRSEAEDDVDQRDRPYAIPTLHAARTNQTGWYEGREWYVAWFGATVLGLAVVLIAWLRKPELRFTWRKVVNTALKETAFIFFLLAVGAVSVAWAVRGSDHAEGEPFSFSNGISAWPTEICRMIALGLIVQFVVKAERDRLDNNEKIEALYRFDPKNPDAEPEPVKRGERVSAQAVWFRHKTASGVNNRLWRSRRFVFAVAFATLYALTARAVILATGEPLVPIRGSNAARLDWWLTLLVIGFTSFYTVFVFMGTLTVYRFIKELMTKTTEYPDGATRQVFEETLRSLPASTSAKPTLLADMVDDFKEAMDIDLIAQRTRVIGSSAYHMLFIFLLLLVSRTSLFDDWEWPPGLFVVFLVTGLLALFTAVSLREAAEAARRKALRLLEARRLRHLASGEGERADVAEWLIGNVKNEKRGAFAVLSQYPLLNAVLVSSGGFGFWILLEYLPQWLG